MSWANTILMLAKHSGNAVRPQLHIIRVWRMGQGSMHWVWHMLMNPSHQVFSAIHAQKRKWPSDCWVLSRNYRRSNAALYQAWGKYWPSTSHRWPTQWQLSLIMYAGRGRLVEADEFWLLSSTCGNKWNKICHVTLIISGVYVPCQWN